MRGHSKRKPRQVPVQKQVGVRELKAQAARIVRQVRDARASYVLTHRGRPVGVILPLEAENEATVPHDPEYEEAWANFWRVGRQIEKLSRPGVSGLRILSEMRR